uniref:Centromere protein X n=1 Tax=Callorhinchus milii TaxID=7868 RepID=V9LEN1_CALMI
MFHAKITSYPTGKGGSDLYSCQELINKLLHFYFKDPKTKINSDAVIIMSEMLKIFVVEAAVRACKQATTEDLECVDIEHFEKILPQLLLDF